MTFIIRYKASFFITLILVWVAVLSIQATREEKPKAIYTHHSWGGSRTSPDSLFQGENSFFASSGVCDHCHGYDPAGIASVNELGQDINVVSDWSSSMMANSARDPYWRAKVSQEVLLHPEHQIEIESTCTKCHAPLGRYAAHFAGTEEYTIAEMVEDTVALDGVSCLACHRQLPQPEVAQHSGTLFYDYDQMVYGPFFSTLVTPMALATDYIPEYGEHMLTSELCAGCHSLITQTLDLQGTPTGGDFVEQATWHEWLNSAYPVENTECQTCHMPTPSKAGVVLTVNYDTPPRSPFALHELAGGNSLMLALMRDNREELGIFANEAQFNETIGKTIDKLQNQSLELTTTSAYRSLDTVFVDVLLSNLAGHKLPSGYPARKMSVHIVVRDENNAVIFESGGLDTNYFIPGEDVPFEQHHDVIRSSSDVQVYEMVMGDVEGNRTTILEHAATHLKDNRLVPRGFTTSNAQYDTTEIVLNTPDADFNFNPAEGSGTDVLHLHIPTENYSGPVQVEVEVYYQSLPPTWINELFDYSTPEIETFESMFTEADQTPVLMKSLSTFVPGYVAVNEVEKEWMSILQAGSDRSWVQSNVPFTLDIYTVEGKKVSSRQLGQGRYSLNQMVSSGVYVLIGTSSDGRQKVERIVIR